MTPQGDTSEEVLAVIREECVPCLSELSCGLCLPTTCPSEAVGAGREVLLLEIPWLGKSGNPRRVSGLCWRLLPVNHLPPTC